MAVVVEDEDEEATTMVVDVEEATLVEILVVEETAVVDVEETAVVDVEEATLVEILVVEATAVVLWIVDPNWYRFMRLLPPQYSELFPAQAYEQSLTSCCVLVAARIWPQKHC
jgi:hypothetical protein